MMTSKKGKSFLALALALMMVWGSAAVLADDPAQPVEDFTEENVYSIQVFVDNSGIRYFIVGENSYSSTLADGTLMEFKDINSFGPPAMTVETHPAKSVTISAENITLSSDTETAVSLNAMGESEISFESNNISGGSCGLDIQNKSSTVDADTGNITAGGSGVHIAQYQEQFGGGSDTEELGTTVSTGDITIGTEAAPADQGYGIVVEDKSGSVDLEDVGTITVNAKDAAVGIAAGKPEYNSEEKIVHINNGISGDGTTLDIDADGIQATATDGYAVGAYLVADEKATIKATIDKGGIQVAGGEDADGAKVVVYDGATATLTVTGNIVAESEDYACGVNAQSFQNGSVVTINAENIQAAGNESSLGADLKSYTGGKVDFNSGSISATGEYAAGVNIDTSNGNINMIVDGNVAGTSYGMEIDVDDEDKSTDASQIDVLITDTLSGGDAAVLIHSEEVADSLTLTVWKAELNEEGAIVVFDNKKLMDSKDSWEKEKAEAEAAGQSTADIDAALGEINSELNKNAETAAAVEKEILYIIKVEQPAEGGTLAATEENGKALAVSHGYNVAKENDRVLLKVNVAAGYKLTGAYNGMGEKVPLLSDADGNYYIDVPKGGGVYLSAALEKLPEEKKEETAGKDKKNETNHQEIKKSENKEVKQEESKSEIKAESIITVETASANPGNQKKNFQPPSITKEADNEFTVKIRNQLQKSFKESGHYIKFMPWAIMAQLYDQSQNLVTAETMHMSNYTSSVGGMSLVFSFDAKFEWGEEYKVVLVAPGESNDELWFITKGTGQGNGTLLVEMNADMLKQLNGKSFMTIVFAKHRV